MTITKDERDILHEWLNELLDIREYVEKRDVALGMSNALNPEIQRLISINRDARGGVASLFIKFAAEAMGQSLKNGAFGGLVTGEVRLERAWLFLLLSRFKPFMGGVPGSSLIGQAPQRSYENLLDAILALEAGEVYPILQPTKGQVHRSHTRAKHELLALCWERNLRASGASRSEAQCEVASAYKVTWDAIRKWRKGRCEKILDEGYVNWFLERATEWDMAYVITPLLGPEYGGGILTLAAGPPTPKQTGKWYQDLRRQEK